MNLILQMKNFLRIFIFSSLVLFQIETASAALSCKAVAAQDFTQFAQTIQHVDELDVLVENLIRAGVSKKTFAETVSRIRILRNYLNKQTFVDAILELPDVFFDYSSLYRKPNSWEIKRDIESVKAYLDSILVRELAKFVKARPENFNQLRSAKFFRRYQIERAIDTAALKRERPRGRELTPMEQNLIWETEVNSYGMRTSLPVRVEVKQISGREVVVDQSSEIPSWIRDQFILSNGDVVFPIHPMNSAETVPFQDRPTVYVADGFLTASRTTYFKSGERYFAVKMPTNYTHPTQPNVMDKANMRKSVLISMNRARHIEAIEKRIGKDPRLILLREVLAIYDNKMGNGFTVRDITALMDGHLYMPAFSFRNLTHAESEQQKREQFEKMVGVSEALLLIRYGLHEKFSHTQNRIAKLDSQGYPIAMALRDMSDTSLVESIARIIAPEALEYDRSQEFTIIPKIEGPTSLIASGYFYMNAFFGTVLQEVGVPLHSAEFPQALRAYHKRLAEKHAKSK